MALPDIMLALLAHLDAQAALTPLVAGRIFGLEVPAEEVPAMPRKALMLRWSGGLGARQAQLTTWRVDVWCYGETPYEAAVLHRTVHQILKATNRVSVAGVLLHNVEESGGPLAVREIDTRWPAVWHSWSVTASDVAVS